MGLYMQVAVVNVSCITTLGRVSAGDTGTGATLLSDETLQDCFLFLSTFLMVELIGLNF